MIYDGFYAHARSQGRMPFQKLVQFFWATLFTFGWMCDMLCAIIMSITRVVLLISKYRYFLKLSFLIHFKLRSIALKTGQGSNDKKFA
jgi:hypothetical protein